MKNLIFWPLGIMAALWLGALATAPEAVQWFLLGMLVAWSVIPAAVYVYLNLRAMGVIRG